MQLSEIVFLGIVLYLLYRFVFNFLLPIVRTTRQVREQFKNMQDHMQNHTQDQPGGFRPESRPDPRQQDYFRQKPNTGSVVKDKTSSSDYIDFEEIK